MKKALPVILFAVLVAVLGFQVRSADAFENASSCAACHTFGNSSSTFHQGHLDMGLPQSCQTCHVSAGDNPVTATCAECHVGPGLRAHHENATSPGPDSCGRNTTGCHLGDPTPAPENTAVPGYAGLTQATLDPCNGSEERFTSLTISLDNDGDLLYDGDDPDCQAAAAPQIDVAPASKAYGDVTVGSSSSQAFTISNGGGADLVVSGMTLTDTTNFSLDPAGGPSGCGGTTPTIAAGDNCTVVVAFSPQSAAAFNGTFSVTSNDATNSPLDVPLTGSGVIGSTPNIAVTPANIDFGQVDAGTSSSPAEMTISNTGSAPLSVSGIALDNAAVYSLDPSGGSNPCGGVTPVIAAGDNCTVDAVFAPVDDGGPFNATVTVESDDPDTPSVDVPFTGTGFLDTDGDGVGDSVDDFPDDASKATPQSATGTGKILVHAGTNALSMVAAVAEGDVDQTGKPSGYTFPDGLVTFQVVVPAAGDNAVVTITFPSAVPTGAKYYKVDAAGFSEFAAAVFADNTVTLDLTDGGNGDTDGNEDSVVTDPGGLAVPVAVPPPPSSDGGGGCSVTGEGSRWDSGAAIALLGLLAMFIALRFRKRKDKQ